MERKKFDGFAVLTSLLFGLAVVVPISLGLSVKPIHPASGPATQRVVIVGAGVGGLAVAARIQASIDCHVTIVEKNSHLGGRCGSFVRTVDEFGSFRHERGASLLLLPDVYRALFQECSGNEKQATDYGLNILQCSPAYQVVFDDGSRLDVGFPRAEGDDRSPAEVKSRDMMNSFESNGALKWDEYMRATGAFLDCGLPNFIEERLDLSSFPAFLKEALSDFGKAWPLKPHSDVLDAVFQSEKMKALASFQDLYVGLEPYRNNELVGGGVLKSTAPAVFGLLAAIELHPSNSKSGVFAPVGGFQSVTEAIERLATELGTTILRDSTVTCIREDGVHIDQKDGPEFLPADLIVCNADLPYATKSLLLEHALSESAEVPPPMYDWDDSFTFSSGVIAFHWSLKRSCNELNTHNVFLMAGSRSQAELSWTILRDNEGDVDETKPFNFYVHRASKTDSSAAPEGCDSIMVLVPCRTLLRDEVCSKLPRDEAIRKYTEQFSDDVVSNARQAVFRRLAAIASLQDLDKDILDEVVDTPATWADQFHVGAGTPFALSHGFAQLSLTRPGPAPFRKNPNLLFCGASTRPGNGVPLVLIGAKQVSNKAIAALKRKEESKQAM
eukprot:scaffold3103_cov136-Cylindrotheca_fusiformis.AAC.9